MLQEIEEYWRRFDERQAVKDREEAERIERIKQMQKSPGRKPKHREQRTLFPDPIDDERPAE